MGSRNPMRLPVAALISLSIISAVLIGWVPPASACGCFGVDDFEAFENADTVFTAELIEIRSPKKYLSLGSNSSKRFIFAVDEVFSGNVSSEQSVVTPGSGAACGLEISGPGPFLIFATDGASDPDLDTVSGELESGLCGGTRLLSDADLPASFGAPYAANSGSSPVGPHLLGMSYTTLAVVATAAVASLLIAALAVFARRRKLESGP